MGKLRTELKYISKLASLGFKLKPRLYVSLVLIPLGSLLEILALSLIYPLLSTSASEQSNSALSVFFDFVSKIEKTNIMLIFLLIILVRVLVGTYAQIIYLKAGKELHGIISSRLFEVIMKSIDYSTIQSSGIGTYSNLAGEESFRFSNIIISIFSLINSLFLCVVFSIAVLLFSPILLGTFVLFGIVTLFLSLKTLKKIKTNGVIQVSLSRSANNYFIDNINNIKSIRCFSAESYTTDSYRRSLIEYTNNLGETDSLHLLIRNVPLIVLLCILLLLLIFMRNLDVANTAYFITSVAYISRLLPVSGQLITAGTRLLNDLKVSRDVTALYNYTPPPDNIAKKHLEQPIKKIDLKNVSYAYEDNRLVLENFSYSFEAGSIYCLAGESGRGKSTILDLLLKFRKPSSGKILFNSLDVNEIETASLRSKAIYLDQKYSIFNDTLENNLTLGSVYSANQIKNAVDSSKLTTLVESKTQGLKTIIEYQGANLSGGQKQRIIIARAFLRNPDVLILDETLSGLDQITKEEIFGSIRNLFKGKIIVIVSHDKWVIENCDQVLKM